jgi:hypothetical protein
LLWRLCGLTSVTYLCGWRREGAAHGFRLPIYDHKEGAGGDVWLATTLLPIPHGIHGEAKLIGELGLRQPHLQTDPLHVNQFWETFATNPSRAPRA